MVVGAEVVIDQGQDLLAAEALVVAAQLLDVADMLGVEQRPYPDGIRRSRQVPAATPLGLECDGGGEIRLGLDAGLQPLQVRRAKKARGLAKDREQRPKDDPWIVRMMMRFGG